jgi:hypothetical protein
MIYTVSNVSSFENFVVIFYYFFKSNNLLFLGGGRKLSPLLKKLGGCPQYITAGMIFFGMNNVNDKSTKNGFDDRIKDQIKSVKQRYLHGVIKWFICTYIIDMEMFMKHFSNIDIFTVGMGSLSEISSGK